MNIFNNINLEEIKKIALKKAKYQKIICFFDSKTDLKLLEEIELMLKNESVLFCINLDTALNVQEMVNDGARCVIWLADDYSIVNNEQYVDDNILQIFVLNEGSLLFRMQKKNSYLFISNNYKLYDLDKLFLFDNLICLKWDHLINSKNYNQEEIINKINNAFETDNIIEVVNMMSKLPKFLCLINFAELKNLKAGDYIIYLYYKIMSYKFLFLSFATQNEFMVDVYKEYENDYDLLNLSYKIFTSERLTFSLKNSSIYMVNFIKKIFDSISCLKKDNELAVIDVNRVLIYLKETAKLSKKDNLLKYSFLYGVFNSIY